jgi:hypothetical protein
MWPWADLHLLDEAALVSRGLRISLGELWKPGEGGLAAAVVGFGEGCTGSFVSEEGLILSNHHCAYPAIQRNSTPEKNLLEEGLWARKKSDELPGHGTRVYVFRTQSDVTGKILGELKQGLSDEETIRQVEAKEKALVALCEQKPHTRCRISRENDGLRFLLLENQELLDIRLVAAPPSALGNFGGEEDNFRWPRHTLDFALARAYVAPDGTPRALHADNVPYKPKRWLRLEPRGVEEGDLVMVLGTPGRTHRYATAAELAWQEKWHYPTRERLFTEWLAALEAAAQAVPASRIPSASRVRALENGRTHARGMREGFRRRRILAGKEAEERRYRAWLGKDPERKRRWSRALDDLTAHELAGQARRERDLLLGYLTWGVTLLDAAQTIVKWAHERPKPDAEREPGYQDRDRERLRSKLEHAQRSFHPAADQAVLAFFLRRLGALGPKDRPEALQKALGGDWSDGRIRAFVAALYQGTRLTDSKARLAAMDEPLAALARKPDSALRLGLALHADWEAARRRQKAEEGARLRLRRPYLESLIAFRGKRFYPDANLTPRVSFAHVAGYSPSDGVWHHPVTTLSGLLHKVRDAPPFALPAPLLERLEAWQHGSGEDPARRRLPLCFLSNADTSGGNSGSPVLDARGRLVGLNFDRVFENVSGDFGYRPESSRNIMVDIRFVLFYLREILGAEALTRELGASKPR